MQRDTLVTFWTPDLGICRRIDEYVGDDGDIFGNWTDAAARALGVRLNDDARQSTQEKS